MFIVRFRMGEVVVIEPMALPLKDIMGYNPDAVWTESHEVVVWNHKTKKPPTKAA